MAQGTVRVEEATLAILREIAREDDEALPATIAKAVEAYRRLRFIERVNAGYAALRQDKRAWADHERELALWDETGADGLQDESLSDHRRTRRGHR